MSLQSIGLTGPMSSKMFPQSRPVNTNYVDLAIADAWGNPQNDRITYYKKRGIGKVVPVPGAAGMGSGISHTVYRVPKSEILTRNQVRKIYKDEENAMIAAQAAERTAAAVVRQGEMNANVAGIVYTNEPSNNIDIDKPINLIELANKAKSLVKNNSEIKKQKMNKAKSKINTNTLKFIKERYSHLGEKRYMNEVERATKSYMNANTIDDEIQALRNKFIETEKGKVYHILHKQAEAKMPKNSSGHIAREYQGSVPKEAARLFQEHIDRKMPKIDAVLAKVREGMIMGFAPPAPKSVQKEENLLRFNELSSINFSAPTQTTTTSTYVDPFEGLNATPNISHKNFTNAGIEIEEETVNHLSKNQKNELLSLLKSMNKASHNAAIDDYLARHLGKGGKRKNKTRKGHKGNKTRKTKRT